MKQTLTLSWWEKTFSLSVLRSLMYPHFQWKRSVCTSHAFTSVALIMEGKVHPVLSQATSVQFGFVCGFCFSVKFSYLSINTYREPCQPAWFPCAKRSLFFPLNDKSGALKWENINKVLSCFAWCLQNLTELCLAAQLRLHDGLHVYWKHIITVCS